MSYNYSITKRKNEIGRGRCPYKFEKKEKGTTEWFESLVTGY